MSDTGWLIERAAVEDAPGIARVQVECWRHNLSAWAPADIVARFNISQQSERYAARIQDVTATLLIARHQGKIIGIVGAKPNSLEPSIYEQYIFALYVAPDWQRRGVGEDLMRQLLLALRENKNKNAILFSFAENLPARRLFEKCGGVLLPHTGNAALDPRIPHISYGFTLSGNEAQPINPQR